MTGLGPQLEVQDQLRRLKRATRLRQAEVVTTAPVTIKLGGSDVVLEDVLVLNGGELHAGDVVPVLAADGNILVLGSYDTGGLETAGPAGGGVWLYSTSTTMADPTSTYVRFNNVDLTLATSIAIHVTDASAINRGAWLNVLDSPLGQNLTFSKIGGTTVAFKVTGTVVTTANWREIPVEWLGGSLGPAADDLLLVNSTGLQANPVIPGSAKVGPTVPVAGALASSAIAGANSMETMAVHVPYPGRFSGVCYWSGDVVAGNVRTALYNSDGTERLATRNTNLTPSGTTTVQVVAFDADVSLDTPGLYWIMLTHSSATNTRLTGRSLYSYDLSAGTLGPPTTLASIPSAATAFMPPVTLMLA